mgnify:CR=1 FL=1|tara:strand:- start:362 stop:742 length:381 start_codon:yes stop_codon:yes gene_type:complete
MGTKKYYGKGGSSMASGKMTSGDGDGFYSPEKMARARDGNMGRIDYFAETGLEMVGDTMEYSMMKKGGAVKKKKKQGYNSRLDESLGMRRGKKKQSMKSRRNESKGAKKAAGKRAYSGNRSSGRKK